MAKFTIDTQDGNIYHFEGTYSEALRQQFNHGERAILRVVQSGMLSRSNGESRL